MKIVWDKLLNLTKRCIDSIDLIQFSPTIRRIMITLSKGEGVNKIILRLNSLKWQIALVNKDNLLTFFPFYLRITPSRITNASTTNVLRTYCSHNYLEVAWGDGHNFVFGWEPKNKNYLQVKRVYHVSTTLIVLPSGVLFIGIMK